MLSTTRRLKRRLWYPACGALRAQAWPSDARVDFAVAGAQKSGTTAVDFYLRQHSEVEMALVKETHFFDDEDVFGAREPAYWRYHSLFPAYRPQAVFGEVTPIYMYWKPAFTRIARYSQDMRILMVLRNPIDRAYSHWNMEVKSGKETLSFRKAIRMEAKRMECAAGRRRFSYISRGMYSEQIKRAHEHFPSRQVLAIRHDDLQNEPQAAMDRIFRFIGVNSIRIRPKRLNCSTYVAPMRRDDRKLLRDIYADEIRELERLLGWNCAGWLRL